MSFLFLFAGVFGIGEPGIDGDGVLFQNSAIRPSDIVDGLSQTFALGERSARLLNSRGLATWTGAVPGSLLWSCRTEYLETGGPLVTMCRKEHGSGMTLGHTGEGQRTIRPVRRRESVLQPASGRCPLPVLRRARAVHRRDNRLSTVQGPEHAGGWGAAFQCLLSSSAAPKSAGECLD